MIEGFPWLLFVVVIFMGPSSRIIIDVCDAQALGFCHRPTLVIPEDVRESRVLTIAHRGASYHVPVEHSLPSYQLALELQADYLEVDLVVSADGILFPMHSVDLNLTTDIATSSVGQQRAPWFSPYANRSGYWAFNYTFAELQTLRLKQREGNSPPRTSIYDHLFQIPSLREVLHLLVEWNTVQLPHLHRDKDVNADTSEAAAVRLPPYLERYKSGLYLEFKTTEWIFAETGQDIVTLLFQDILHDLTDDDAAADTAASHSWKHLLSCYERVRFDEYIVPPLILQSFNGTDLSRFHELWHNAVVNGADTSAGTSNQLSTLAPEPAYILLVDQPTCWDDTFWYMVSRDEYRSYLSGIGCNKACLLIPESNNNTFSNTSTLEEAERLEDAREHLAALIQRVSELQLVLHVWTERPETSYLARTDFPTVTEEIHFLNCNVSHVHGIFTESVDRAVQALQLPCDDGIGSSAKKSPVTNSGGGSTCSIHNPESSMFWIVGLASFVMGMLFLCGIQRALCRKTISSYRVQNSDEFDHELEMSVT